MAIYETYLQAYPTIIGEGDTHDKAYQNLVQQFKKQGLPFDYYLEQSIQMHNNELERYHNRTIFSKYNRHPNMPWYTYP